MSLQASRTLRAWAFCCAAVVLAGAHLSAQKEFSSATNKRLGQAAVQFKDKTIHVVAAYYYSQRNHDSRWLYIQSALSTAKDTIIHRNEIVLRTPQGREIPLATQSQVGDDVKRVEQLLQNALVQSHDVVSYFRLDRVEDMQMFRLPFGPVVHNEFVVDRDRVAAGPLFFESPTGAWEKGTYTLVVRHKNGTAELPIILE